MHQIHSREIREKADEKSQTGKNDNKEIEVDLKEKENPKIDIITKLEDDENWGAYQTYTGL